MLNLRQDIEKKKNAEVSMPVRRGKFSGLKKNTYSKLIQFTLFARRSLAPKLT